MKLKYILLKTFLLITFITNLKAASADARDEIRIPVSIIRSACEDQLLDRDAQDGSDPSKVFSEPRNCEINGKPYQFKFYLSSFFYRTLTEVELTSSTEPVSPIEKVVGGPNLDEILKFYAGDEAHINIKPMTGGGFCISDWPMRSQWELSVGNLSTKAILAKSGASHANTIPDDAETFFCFILYDPALATAK